jgi:hypothetical protein
VIAVPLPPVDRGPGLSQIRIEACACGGHISAAADLPLAIAAAVLTHNRTERHLAWARRLGFVL